MAGIGNKVDKKCIHLLEHFHATVVAQSFPIKTFPNPPSPSKLVDAHLSVAANNSCSV